jgi:hypothetical protein
VSPLTDVSKAPEVLFLLGTGWLSRSETAGMLCLAALLGLVVDVAEVTPLKPFGVLEA